MNCLDDNQLNQLLCGAPDLDALEHAASCETCAARLADILAAVPQLNPPKGLPNEVMHKIHAPQSGESFGHYALRVFAAMAAALVLLFSGAFDKLAQLPQEMPKLKEQISIIFMKEEPEVAQKSQ